MASATTERVVEINPKLDPKWTQPAMSEARVSGPRLPAGLKYQMRKMIGTTAIHGLVHAAHMAFVGHYTLILRPQDLWFTLLTGLATHVARDPEKHRDLLVKHAEGKQTLQIRNDNLLGTPSAWEEVFPAFQGALKAACAENEVTAAIFGTTFDTVDPAASIAMTVATMDVMNSYFEYHVMTLCGIPRVVLKESKASWVKLAAAVRQLDLPKLGLEKWSTRLLAVLDKIAEEYDAATPDISFWSSLYKHENGSGGEKMNGWLLHLFPYTAKGQEMPAYNPESWGIGVNYVPSSVSSVPFEWTVGNAAPVPMRFYAGIDDAKIDHQAYTVECQFGWAVAHVAAP